MTAVTYNRAELLPFKTNSARLYCTKNFPDFITFDEPSLPVHQEVGVVDWFFIVWKAFTLAVLRDATPGPRAAWRDFITYPASSKPNTCLCKVFHALHHILSLLRCWEKYAVVLTWLMGFIIFSRTFETQSHYWFYDPRTWDHQAPLHYFGYLIQPHHKEVTLIWTGKQTNRYEALQFSNNFISAQKVVQWRPKSQLYGGWELFRTVKTFGKKGWSLQKWYASWLLSFVGHYVYRRWKSAQAICF